MVYCGCGTDPREVVGETDKEQTVNPMTVVLNLLNVSVLITLTDRTYYVMIVANGSVVESFASCDAMLAVMRVWSVMRDITVPGDLILEYRAVQSRDGKYISLCVTEKAPGRCEYLVLASDGEHIEVDHSTWEGKRVL